MSDSHSLPGMSTAEMSVPGQQQTGIPERIGEFQILGILGEGGMGVVYRATQENPRREVAVKVMRPGSVSAARLRRFEHEKHAMGRLQHAGIAQVYVAGVAETPLGTQPYMAMELVRGVTLSKYVAAQRPSIRARLQLMLDICDAVQHAHLNGVIHRDLKPGNILVDETGRVKVVDFGVARLVETDAPDSTAHTEVGQLVGTLPYMSPEQAAGEPDAVDLRSDVYALGVICYELLAGQGPYDFGARSPVDIIRAIENQEPMPLSKHDRALKGDLEVVLSKALDKDPSRRYQSASELAADLSRYLAEEPVSARPASTWYQLKKLAKRHPAATGGLSAVLLLLTAYAVTTGALWQSERAQRTKAEGLAEEKGKLLVEKEGLLDDKGKLLGNVALQAADLATQRGRWTVALDKLAEAKDATVDRQEIRLRTAIAQFHLNRTVEARRELDSLEAEPLVSSLAARVVFWRGAVLADSRNTKDQARELLNRSLESKSLTAAERAYAEALVADETPKRIEGLRSAIEKDPFFLHAHELLMVHLTFLGDFDGASEAYRTASLLFPDDPNLQLFQAIALAVVGKPAEAQALIDDASIQFGPQQTELGRAVVNVMDLFGQFGRAQYPKDNLRSVALLVQITAELARLSVAAAACESLPDSERAQTISSGTRFFLDSYERLPVVLTKYASGFRADALTDLDEAVRVHPEGFLRAMRGQMHYDAGRYLEAADDFQAAADGPMLVPVKGLAIDMLFDCQWRLVCIPNPSPELQDRCRATLRRLLDYHCGPNETDRLPMSEDQAGLLVHAATALGNSNLAREILEFYYQQGATSAMVKFREAELEFKLERYSAALIALREAQQLPASDDLRKDIATSIPNVAQKLRDQMARLLDAPFPVSRPGDTNPVQPSVELRPNPSSG